MLFATEKKRFVDVILPLPMAKYYTYSFPDAISPYPQIGSRVVVPFGRNKTYTGIVVEVHDRKPEEYDAKDILSVCDDFPIIFPLQIKFWEWISDYYLCPIGDVYKAAMPAALKNEEDEKGGYTPKQEDYVRFTFSRKEEERLKEIYTDLGRSPKQLHVVMSYIALSQFMLQDTPAEVSKKLLYEKAEITSSHLKTLVDKGIFEIYQKEVSRLGKFTKETQDSYQLNAPQTQALQEIEASFQSKDTTLLFGITGSGKTEIYIRLIEKALSENKQVLYLVPEIALTTQLTERLQRVFGKRIGIYHSKFSGNERTEIWMKLLKDEGIDIILGVRSSVFLPFQRLGLVIVDEEHETTYKQYDPAPRYHARNAAIVLAKAYNAKVLLGTATPAFETYMNALSGKYGLVELTSRHEGVELPEILPVDIKELKKKKRMRSSFSPLLIEEMDKAFKNNEQVILFQNRRGFAPLVECSLCAYVPKCKHCDVSLTYHKGLGQLTCHYCGYTQPVTRICPACGHHSLETIGYGTERIEDEIKEIFPDIKVERMDMDTTRSKKAYQEIIERFQTGKTQILIGTQMVSKGLDFDNVSVVGILNADTLMNYPDFRSYERAYQLMAQVSGRAGRKNKRGLVILQTSDPAHPVIREVVTNNYKEMFAQQMAERKLFKYPPYYRLIYIYLKHKDGILLDRLSQEMAIRLRNQFGDRILGPDNPPVSRIQNLYIKKIVLKIESNISPAKVKELLHTVRLQMLEDERFKSLFVYYDVDPL